MAKGRAAGRKSEGQQPPPNPAAERRAILWSAAAFLAVAVAGLLFAPGLRLLWVILLGFGIAAVPQALRRGR
jgi:cyanate permease